MIRKHELLFKFISLVFAFVLLFVHTVYAYTLDWDPGTGTLTINVTDENGEHIVVCTCLGGDVTINGDYPPGDRIHAVDVKKLIVTGGPGPDFIDLKCIGHFNYPNLARVGNDFKIEVDGGAGNDHLDGSDHGDLINGGSGDDDIDGGPGDDELHGGSGDDDIYGFDGDDRIYGDAGDDYIEGEEGNDTINGGDDNDIIYGGSWDYDMYGEDSDTIYGDDGNDYVCGCEGADKIYGGAGNDVIGPDMEDTEVDGGPGDDRVVSLVSFFDGDFSLSPRTLILTDTEGNDELDFSNGTRGVRLNLDLLDTPQLMNDFGYNLRLNGVFENYTGTPQDDEITLKAIPGITRNIVCGLQVNADVLNFDAEGEVVINSGFSLDCCGNDILVTYAGVEVVNILNEPTGVETVDELPVQFALNQNYPNPFNPTTTISYSLPEQVNVTLKIFDSLGNEIAELINEEQHAGLYEVNFNANEFSSGIYYYKITAGNYTETKSMMLLK